MKNDEPSYKMKNLEETHIMKDSTNQNDISPPGTNLRCILKGYYGDIKRIVWSPDGKLLASISEGNHITIWDFKTGECLKIIDDDTSNFNSILDTIKWMKTNASFKDYFDNVAWSPDGKMFAWGSFEGYIHILDTETWETSIKFKKSDFPIFSLAWSPNGKYLASSLDDPSKKLLIWEVKNWKLIDEYKSKSLLGSLEWSHDSQMLASATDNDELYIWSWHSSENKLYKRIFYNFRAGNFNIGFINLALTKKYLYNDYFPRVLWLDSNLIASTDGIRIKIINTDLGETIKILEGHKDVVNYLSFYQYDGLELLVSKSADSIVRLWEIKTGATIAILGETCDEMYKFYDGLSFHPHKPYFATLCQKDASICIWELNIDILMDSASKVSYVNYTNAKVVLVGNSSTGKSCLARALMGESFKPQESTHGMKVWNFHSEVTEIDENRINRDIFLWDLAGQLDYQLIHQLFLDETALGVILFDSTNIDDPFAGVGYWKKALEKVVEDDCPKILVAGRVDRGHSTVTSDDIDKFCLENNFNFFIETSSKTGEGIHELKEAINSEIKWETLPLTSSPELWNDIRKYLLERRDGDDVLTKRLDLLESYKNGHSEAIFNENEFNTVISHAQAQGLLWKLSFGDFILLKPEILNDYASAIINVARNHPEGLGSVSEIDILNSDIEFEDMERINPDSEKLLLHAVVELLIDREIALREGDYLVFPSKFNRKWSELPEDHDIEVIYSFEGPIEDIYASLIVRIFYSNVFKKKDIWKDGAEFYDPSGNICGIIIKNHEGKGTISIFFENNPSIDIRVLFSMFIHEHLEKKAIFGSVKRERIYKCTNCGEKVKDRQAIIIRLERDKQDIICQYCDTSIPLLDLIEEKCGDLELLSQLKELDEMVVEKKEEAIGITTIKAKKEIDEFDIFLAHNSEDKDLVEKIAEELYQRGLNPWFDKWNLPPGRMFQEEIEKVLPSIKSVAVIVGSNGIGPWENMEMRVAISQFVKRESPVMPILLPDVNNEPDLPLFLEEFNWVKFIDGIDDCEALDNIVWGITGENPRRKLNK